MDNLFFWDAALLALLAIGLLVSYVYTRIKKPKWTQDERARLETVKAKRRQLLDEEFLIEVE